MESLDKEWIFHGNVQQCEQFEKTPNTLGLKNMAGVFILVGAGIVGGIGLIIIEVVYKKHQIKKQKRLEIARHAADKWRGTIEVSLSVLTKYGPGILKVLFRFVEAETSPAVVGNAKAVQRRPQFSHEINKPGGGYESTCHFTAPWTRKGMEQWSTVSGGSIAT